MPHEVRGVIAAAKGDKVKVGSVLVPDPGPSEALVRVQACGVCHTDLHYREGAINDEFPFLLGHEASGIVEQVGDGVSNVEPGDFVIIAWRAPCGTCRSCVRGRPWYCFASKNAQQPMTLADGTALSPPEIAGLVGCGIMAGLGAAINTGGVSRGDSVAVFGCGGVGDAAIAGSHLAGAHTIIAVDIDDRKLEWAKDFGATHVINSSETDPIKAIRDLTGGNGVNVAIEAVGNPVTYEQAFYSRDHAGTVVLVGVPSPDMKIELPLLEIFGRGGALKSSWYGDCLPSRDFSLYIDLYLQGRLPLDKFVSETIALDDVEEAFAKMERGEVLRSVVTF